MTEHSFRLLSEPISLLGSPLSPRSVQSNVPGYGSFGEASPPIFFADDGTLVIQPHQKARLSSFFDAAFEPNE